MQLNIGVENILTKHTKTYTPYMIYSYVHIDIFTFEVHDKTYRRAKTFVTNQDHIPVIFLTLVFVSEMHVYLTIANIF